MDLLKETTGEYASLGDVDNSVVDGNVSVAFRDIETFVVDAIERYPVVIGCVAWLTNRAILKALAARRETAIILQKEDFLRPDRGGPKDAELRRLYAALPKHKFSVNYGFHFDHDTQSYETDAVRCVGYVAGKNRSIPRMHNKFLVLCDRTEDGSVLAPRAVLTGSFNMTHNATRSLENVVLLEDATIAKAYLDEFAAIYGASEPLNWSQPYVDPNYTGPDTGRPSMYAS